MSLAIIPGSFDPMTLGHLELVKTVAKRYDEVVVAVMVNRSKKYLFDMETRVAIAEETVKELPNVRVIADDGMLIDLYDRLGANAVCKGVRNETDLAYENNMAEWNHAHNPRFGTELIQAEDAYTNISSTDVRNAMKNKEELSSMVHASAIPLLLQKTV